MHPTHEITTPYPTPITYHPVGILDRMTTALAAVPAVCFTGALLTDIAYANSPDMQWTNFSAWLLAVGMVFAVIATVSAIIAYIAGPRTSPSLGNWLFAGSIALILVTAMINNLVHSRDAWTSVVPTGLTLSALTVILMIAAAFLHYRNVSLAYWEKVS